MMDGDSIVLRAPSHMHPASNFTIICIRSLEVAQCSVASSKTTCHPQSTTPRQSWKSGIKTKRQPAAGKKPYAGRGADLSVQR